MNEEKKITSFEENYASNRTILADVLPLSLPMCISIEPSNFCNFRCIMCSHGNEKYRNADSPLQHMEWELFEKCILQIGEWCNKVKKKLKLMRLYSMGEPLLNEHICEMVRRIKEADIAEQLEITSNASLLTEEIGQKLVDYGLDIFRASIYSIDTERNFEITKNSVNPENICQNLSAMRRYRDSQGKDKPFICAKMIDAYSDENERFQKKYAEIADEACIDKIENLADSAMADYYGDRVNLAMEDNERVRVKDVKRRACRYPFTHLTIKSDGKVVVCCADWARQTVVGDVNKKTLQEIWNSKPMYEFRCMMLRTKGETHEWCRKCDVPLRGYDEDNIDDFPIEKLSYWE